MSLLEEYRWRGMLQDSTAGVEAALADLRVERTLPKAEKSQRLARRFLNNPPDTITVRRVVEATPEEVFSAMQAVFPNDPFRLTLTDQQGDPLHGGLLVFDLPGVKNPFERGFAFETAEAAYKSGAAERHRKVHPVHI